MQISGPALKKVVEAKAFEGVAAARGELVTARRPPGHLQLSSPQSFVHCMLFLIEYSASSGRAWEKQKAQLGFFFARSGGVHLLLLLLNAYYNKPLAGRSPGWVLRALRGRIDLSERALRMLLNDAIAEGLVVARQGTRDRRTRRYELTPSVVAAWDKLTETLRTSLSEVLAGFDPGALANADYRIWDPDLPAVLQRQTVSPSRRNR